MLSAHFLCAPQVSPSARLYPIDRSFIFIFPMKNCNYTSHFLPNLSQISIFWQLPKKNEEQRIKCTTPCKTFRFSISRPAMPHRGIFNLKEIGFLRSCRNRTDALTCAHSLAALVPGCPGKGKKMLLHSVMRKKPDNFLSRHCHYSMFRRRGCKEKPPFLQIFLSFCCGQQNGSPLFISGLNLPLCSVSAAE